MYCQNCGTQLQDGASFCPSCGKSTSATTEPKVLEHTPVESSSSKRRWPLLLLAGFFALALIKVYIDGPMKTSTTESTQKQLVSVPSEPVKPSPIGNWIQRTGTSEFDDSKTVVLSLEAENEVEGWSSKATPTLILRCKENKTEAYVNLGMQPAQGYSETGELNTTVARVRFGDAQAIRAVMDVSTDGKAVFFRQPIGKINAMMGADEMLFGFVPFNASPAAARFDVRGLSEAVGPLRETCRW